MHVHVYMYVCICVRKNAIFPESSLDVAWLAKLKTNINCFNIKKTLQKLDYHLKNTIGIPVLFIIFAGISRSW